MLIAMVIGMLIGMVIGMLIACSPPMGWEEQPGGRMRTPPTVVGFGPTATHSAAPSAAFQGSNIHEVPPKATAPLALD